ncbi:hypothetical protein C7377_0934 [Balneicella halophila]|uniref:Uncharacterized protein n=1 Tax=Balneicella halophila TaxID=1537566 RepID=A0A7L4US48_BALHA|nr:hypothetical protein [Balneicella halophila]PVX52605.1 hypothetical protein C7377_0934 [Balneicella halophila]
MKNISKIVLYIIIAITVVVMGLFYFGGGTEGALSTATDADVFYQPNYTSLALNLAFVLMIVAIAAALIIAIWGFIQSPKESMKSLLGLALLAAVVFVAYMLTDTDPVLLSDGRMFTNEFRLTLAGVCIWTSWILLILTILSIAFSYVIKLTK